MDNEAIHRVKMAREGTGRAKLRNEGTIRAENLDPVIEGIGDEHLVAVDRNAVWVLELAGPLTVGAVQAPY